MGQPILFQLSKTLQDFKKQCLKKLMKEQEFKAYLKNLFDDLTTFDVDPSFNDDPAAVDNLIELTKGICDGLLNLGKLSKLYLLEIAEIPEPIVKFKKWQKFFTEVRAEYAQEIDSKLWNCYFKKQVALANDPSSAFNSEAFEGLVCQYLTDFLKRAGAMIYELIAELINGAVYINSEGQQRLFVEHEGSVKSGKEQLQEYYKSVSGNKHAPPPASTPAAP